MKAYLANCTAQNHVANFQLPDSRKPIALSIPAGRQVEVPGDLSTPAIEAMVDQLGPYGLVHVDDAGKGGKITFLYSTSPISATAMMRAVERNKGHLRNEGAERRKLSAVAANAVMNTDDTPINKMEASVEEVTSGDLTDRTENIAEGIKIDNKAEESNENRKPRNRGNRNKNKG